VYIYIYIYICVCVCVCVCACVWVCVCVCRYLRFAVLVVVTVKSTIFWVVTPYSSERARHFVGTYRLHLQGRIVSQARNQRKQEPSWACLGEYGGVMFLRNVGLSPNYTTLQLRRPYSSVGISFVYFTKWVPLIKILKQLRGILRLTTFTLWILLKQT
jgi:hypothetical protein